MPSLEDLYRASCNLEIATVSNIVGGLAIALPLFLLVVFVFFVRSMVIGHEFTLLIEVLGLLPLRVVKQIEELRTQHRRSTIWHKIAYFFANLPLASDQNLKCKVEPIHNALELVRQMRPVKFAYKGILAQDDGGRMRFGLIAQEIEKILPEAVDKTDDGYLQIDYSCLIAVLLQAVIELDVALDSVGRDADGPGMADRRTAQQL